MRGGGIGGDRLPYGYTHKQAVRDDRTVTNGGSVVATSVREPAAVRRRAKKKRSRPLWQELVLLLGIALLLSLVVKTFLLQAFYVPSGSMEDTLVRNDRILVEKVSGWDGDEPARGDIVVFADPGGWLDPSEVTTANTPLTKALATVGLYPTGGHLVKRVIGIGGDTVMCCDKQGRMVVNGSPLEEDYLARGDKPSLIKFEVQIPEGYLWVQGDHRSNSRDSRYHLQDADGGMVSADLVVGRVFALIWPVDRARTFDRPGAFEAVD